MPQKVQPAAGGRNSNLELLRIISMVLILFHHYSLHGFPMEGVALGWQKRFLQFLSLGGKVGVNLFVLISGYFLIESRFQVRKLLKLLAQVLFYSLGLFGVTVGLGITDFSLRSLYRSILPISTGLYWFMTAYVILYLLSPYLNSWVKGMQRRQHGKLLGIFLVLWVVIGTLPGVSMAYSALFWFVVLYLLSAYLRLYPQEGWQHNRRLQAGACLAAGVLLCLSVVIIDLLSLRYPALASHATDFKKENSIFVFVLSVSLFLLFLHRRPFVNRWINQLALSMLGVYLLHENELLYPTMFQDWLNGPKWLASPWLAVHALLSVAAIFAAGVVIDQLRIFLLERPLFSLLDRHWNGITAFLRRSLQRRRSKRRD